MKKQRLVFASSLTVLFTTSFDVNGQSIITNTVLNAGDIPGMEITRTSTSPWWHSEDKNLDIDEAYTLGMQQTIKTNNITLRVFYSEFSSVDLAQQAIQVHMRRVAASYSKGIWWGAKLKKIGDFSWYGDEGALLIISGTTCFQVSSSNGDRATRRKLCEQLAIIIDNKIKNGSHVIVSEENPPPVTAPAPPPTP